VSLVVVRCLLTLRENDRVIAASHHEAVTDALSGLPNRRRLLADLADACGTGGPATLAFFDLDGFKLYNDTFGHGAGDSLLARLGGALARAVAGRGVAYRLGGDEFCVLFDDALAPDAPEVLTARRALSERGERFAVTASLGLVVVPDDAAAPEEAMRRADERMYADKRSNRTSGLEQVTDVLRATLRECEPSLGEHHGRVAALANAVARRLDCDNEIVDEVTRAAALHDVGKVAIPDALLGKAGPLTDDEWAFIRRHTVIGERIVSSAPALRPVAAIIRSSHEHVDGSGYPDGLAGEEIPLASRIVAVCDAWDAMLEERPYQPARPAHAALEELRRCAGTQFDPRVVEAAAGALAGEAAAPVVPPARRAGDPPTAA
jgi:diguanylate cyclase (GGDEF)-like protein